LLERQTMNIKIDSKGVIKKYSRMVEIDLRAFGELTKFEQIELIHAFPNLFINKYRDVKRMVSNEIMGDGYKKAAPMDSVKSSNSSGIDDVTARTAINRTLITSGNIEDIIPYGKDEWLDTLIDFERAMKLYIAIIDSYDGNMSNVLSMRLEGIKHEKIAKEFFLDEGTVTQYVHRSKATLKERFEELNALFEAKKRLRRIAKEENGVGNLKKASND